jgi:hypothetical protein
MCAIMIALYIVGLSTMTCGLYQFNHRKDGGDDENCNRNRRKGGPKKLFWYFPIIPHLKRWFGNKESELL